MNQTDLTGFIVEIIKGRLSAGWKLPVTVSVISANGCLMSGAYMSNESGDGVDYEEHVNQVEAAGMQLPIQIVVSNGDESITVTLERDGRLTPRGPFSKN